MHKHNRVIPKDVRIFATNYAVIDGHSSSLLLLIIATYSFHFSLAIGQFVILGENYYKQNFRLWTLWTLTLIYFFF